ncbi:MAG: peptide-methionine (S)-S-oxide reductase MsrA [Taibaiella sp.]|nr:peptide-methionine (S)-S-oxide reductase MsrA [Taibaiella sp.]
MKIVTLSAIAVFSAISFVSCGQTVPPQQQATVAKNYSKDKVKDLSKYSQATFAAGCFWHEETLFESVKGVMEVVSGYAGGSTQDPSYESIETGKTGHAETINVYYNPSVISYATLLKVYFEGMEDPTQVNGQGPDRGTQYRSVIFYRNAAEQAAATSMVNELNKSGKYGRPIAATVVPLNKFWKAEGYHQDYINTNTDNPYVSRVSIPGIAHFQSAHPEMIKPGRNFSTGK